MASLTDAQLLEATREAIDALTIGGVESYSLNGRTVTKQHLDTLWEQVDRLETRIARAARGMFGIAQIRRPA